MNGQINGIEIGHAYNTLLIISTHIKIKGKVKFPYVNSWTTQKFLKAPNAYSPENIAFIA